MCKEETEGEGITEIDPNLKISRDHGAPLNLSGQEGIHGVSQWDLTKEFFHPAYRV